jgi:hypothetical protein
VPRSDPAALAAKIREVVLDPDRMDCMSVRNLAEVEENRDEVLPKRRAAVYRYAAK